MVGGYGLLLLLIGFGIVPRIRGERASEAEEYLLAGRRLTLPLFVATLVATWYGAIIGVGEFVHRYGVVAWLCVGVPYYLVAFVFAFAIAGRIRASQTLTIPQQMCLLYGQQAGRIAALVMLLITIPASYLLMLATLLQAITGWSLEIALVVGALFSVAYLYTGGFRADVLTNALQFVLMYAGFAVLLGFCVQRWGSPLQMWQALPPAHRSVPGLLGWSGIAVWFLIALQTFVDPSFYQRCAAARSVRTARMGIAISVLFWLLFDAISITTALYARAFVPTEPLNTYPALAEAVLPVGWKGVFVVALFAAVMSTLESYAFLSAATVGHDLLSEIPGLKGRYSVRRLTQIGLLLTMGMGIGMAGLIPSAVELIVRTASLAVPALLFPFVFGYTQRFRLPKNRVAPLMGLTTLSAAVWMLLGELRLLPGTWHVVQPAFVGLVVGLGISLLWMRRNHGTVAVDGF